MSAQDIKVPDLGSFQDVPVIDVLVQPGDVVEVDTPLLTLETDKATMDVPSPIAGTVEAITVVRGGGCLAGPAGLAPLLLAAQVPLRDQVMGQRIRESPRFPLMASGQAKVVLIVACNASLR